MGLAAFCLMAGSRWLVEQAWPQMSPSLLRQSLHYAAVGAVALLLQEFCSDQQKARLSLWRTAFAGLLLLGIPLVLQQGASVVRPETSVALYGMTPLWIVLGRASMHSDASRAMMLPALAGFAGVLLLLPWLPPSTAVEAIAFGLVVIGVWLTAVGSLWAHTLIGGRSLMQVVAVIALPSAALLGLAGAIHGPQFVAWTSGDSVALVFESAQMFLFVWLLRELEPSRFAARFLLVPFVTIVEGAILLRGSSDVRMAIGILLLLFGASSLLYGERDTPTSFQLS